MPIFWLANKIKKTPCGWAALYQCDCGNLRYHRPIDVTRKNMNSCGCAKPDRFRKITTKHGKWNTSTYVSWMAMKTRCINKNAASYRWYGAKGITVCKEWQTFEGFLASMGEKPSSEYCIDRIDSSKVYMPSNCRWATKSENSKEARSRDNAHL